MKGKMVLENKIAKILKPFGVKVAMYKQFLYSEGWVFFTPFEDPSIGNHHRGWIAENYGIEMNASAYFLFSLLHEVGHHMTIKDMTEEDLDYETFCRNVLSCADGTPEEINEAYYNLPAEILATEWALTYMVNNPTWCKKAYGKMFKAIRHFANVNRWEI